MKEIKFRLWDEKQKRYIQGWEDADDHHKFEGDLVGCSSDSIDTTNLSIGWWNEPDGHYSG